ncbi:NUDIX domain-containing protein [Paenibacillus sp. RC67]|uniref:NUDIX domain-containing protein n=1 Tax=Paenibacillus sp. RC67 TaxID=3039392 RepID=UPI0024AD5234|nr:NUDIX domain-containing protein [Paenibacillus sp. RC67]
MIYPDIVLPRLRYQYCPMCRSELSKQVINDDQIERVCCPQCKWVHFPSNAIGVVILITAGNGIVAILPPKAPLEYPAALPAGHGEYGESPEEAAIREAYEETGFQVEITDLLGWQFNKNLAYPGPMINFFYEAKAIGGSIRDSEEGRVKVFALDNFPAIAPQRGGSRKTMELYLQKINSLNGLMSDE